MAIVRGIQISSGTGGSALTQDQKRFNTLIRQIEQMRATLSAWNANIPLYAQAHTQLVVPLIETLAAARRDWAFALDRVLDQPGWTRAERAALRERVCDCAAELLDANGEDDAELKALFDKHGEVDFDTGKQHTRAVLKDFVETMTGVDLGDETEIASDAELYKRMQERLAAQAASAGEQTPETAGRTRGKTAAQRRRESEAHLATQSMREIFRKLASALHPDRETDPVRRVAKTALMQKVNQAYAANDLLTLLELQLQIEQVDADHIASASAQRLKHYNKVLSEQLVELRAEVERVEARFRVDFCLDPGWGLNPTKLVVSIDQNVKHLRAGMAMHHRDMRMLADKAATKRWLKREQQRLRDTAFDDEFF